MGGQFRPKSPLRLAGVSSWYTSLVWLRYASFAQQGHWPPEPGADGMPGRLLGPPLRQPVEGGGQLWKGSRAVSQESEAKKISKPWQQFQNLGLPALEESTRICNGKLSIERPTFKRSNLLFRLFSYSWNFAVKVYTCILYIFYVQAGQYQPVWPVEIR